MRYMIGLDIGGTKIACGLVSEAGEVEEALQVASDITSGENMYQSVRRALDDLLHRISLPLTDLSLGVGVPGLVDQKNGIAVFQNNLPWGNFPLVERLRADYPGFLKIVLDNDVYQATYAEWEKAHLGDQDTLVFLTASTGISCATLVGGRFLRGQGFAGEVGLLPIEKAGKMTTLEALIGGNHLAARGQALLGLPDLTTKDLFEGFFAGDVAVQGLISEWIKDFAVGLYALIAIIDPSRIVLGGSILKLNPPLLPLIKAQLKDFMLPDQLKTLDHITITQFDNNAGLIGAAWSAM